MLNSRSHHGSNAPAGVVLLALAALLTGCPDPPPQNLCEDVVCPALTACDDDSGRCVAPEETSHTRSFRQPSLALYQDTLYVAAYATDTKDLVIGVWDDLDGRFHFQLIDGVGDVGQYPSLGISPEGRPAIAYFDATRLRLKYAFLRDDDTWQVEVADDTASVGLDVDLVIDDEGVTHVAYRDLVNKGLRYAQRSNDIWRFEAVDFGSDSPEVIAESEACPPQQRNRVDDGVGYHAHMALQGGTPIISYYDADCGALRLARKGAERWNLRVVDGWSADDWTGPTDPPATEVGRFNDIVVDAQGVATLVYYDPHRAALNIARSEGAAPSIEVVDDGLRRPEDDVVEKRVVGQFPTIVLDLEGNVVVAHLDSVTRTVLVSEQAGDGWLTAPLGASFEAFENDMVIGPDGRRFVVGVNRINPNAEHPLQLAISEKAAE